MSRATHKLRILVAAVAVGSLTVLGLASTAQARETDSPLGLLDGVCVARKCGDGAASEDGA